MFDKRAFMSHVKNETANDKMLKAGVKAPFYGELEEKYGKKITKSHGKNYPKGTHMCATHVEHAEWGQGTPVHGEHAAPDENGQISWYNVMFEHGVETVNTSDMKILAEAGHGNHEHHEHDHPGEDLNEISFEKLVDAQVAAKKELETNDELSPERRKKLQRQTKKFGDAAREMFIKFGERGGNRDRDNTHALDALKGRYPEKVEETRHIEEQAKKLDIIIKTLTGRGDEPGEKTPGRGEDPTDHYNVDGEPRDPKRSIPLADRRMIAARYKSMKSYDPNTRRDDAVKSYMMDKDQDLY